MSDSGPDSPGESPGEHQAQAQRLSIADLYQALEVVNRVVGPLPLALLGLDQEARIVLANNRLLRFFGFKQTDLYRKSLNRIFPGVKLDSGLDAVGKPYAKLIRPDGSQGDEQVGRLRDGGNRSFQVMAYPQAFGHGVVTFLAIRDVGEEKRTREALKERDDLVRSVIAGLPAMVSAKDKHGRYVIINDYQADVFGIPVGEAIGRTTSDILGEEAGAEIDNVDMRLAAGKGMSFSTEERYPDAEGRDRVWLTTKSTLKQRDGEIDKVFSVSIDISEKKMLEEKAEAMDTFDALTGLPNRPFFMRRVKDAVSQAKRSKTIAGLVVIDLDNLAEIGRSGPEGLADYLVRRAAIRLCAAVGEEDEVARFGHDSFGVLLGRPSSTEEAEAAGRKFAEAVGRPYSHDGNEYALTAFSGAAIYPDDGVEPRELLEAADHAINRARSVARNVEPFSDTIAAERKRRKVLRSGLRKALEQDRFQNEIVAEVALEDMTVSAAESVLKFQTAKRGLIGPDDYMSAAEEAGLSEAIAEKALRVALESAAGWRDMGLADLAVAVRLAEPQFHLPNLADLVGDIVVEQNLPIGALEILIPEAVAMMDPDLGLSIFEQIHDQGAVPVLDDFGAGQTSLGHLGRLPIGKVRLAESVVTGDAKILGAAMLLAREFGFKVTAKGIRSGEMLRMAADLGCHFAQGPMIAQPSAPAAFDAILQKNGGRLTA
ncbi:MAG: EAL domain-containing protein [Alphaproteobacteria bacterium]|nr:EAL domain-containing protein [Alphaproteobacteria bacterium]